MQEVRDGERLARCEQLDMKHPQLSRVDMVKDMAVSATALAAIGQDSPEAKKHSVTWRGVVRICVDAGSKGDSSYTSKTIPIDKP